MLKKELVSNLKSLSIFSIIIVSLLLSVSLVYPSIAANMEGIDQMMEMFPEDLLKAFNMDVISISTLCGWLLTEGYMFIQLLGSCYFAILGGTIVLKETSEGTIDFLYSKPVTKKQIIVEKMKCGVIYIIIFSIMISLSTLIGLLINDDYDIKRWLLMSVLPVLTYLYFFTLSIFTSLFIKKTNQSIGINIGLVFIIYFINMVALLAEKVDFLKYLSVFYYTDSKDIVVNNALSIEKIIPVCLVIIIIRYISIKVYERKELGL